ncbi:hypothetical protein TNCV_587011 [Trichonephila clavipes]|nr:hypothetical protein TNCV_587011 [Trichonephila clavipes]
MLKSSEVVVCSIPGVFEDPPCGGNDVRWFQRLSYRRMSHINDTEPPSCRGPNTSLYLPKSVNTPVPFWIPDTEHRMRKRNVRCDPAPGWGESY